MKADEPKGETTAYGEWQYSSAQGRYHSEDGNKSARVGLFDYAHIPLLYAPFQMIMNMKMSTESTEGYERSTKIGGFPAHEKWTKDGQDNEVTIMVADRFVLTTTPTAWVRTRPRSSPRAWTSKVWPARATESQPDIRAGSATLRFSR